MLAHILIIIVSAAFLENVVLNQFLGICSFLGVSNRVGVAAGMGGAVVFVITLASAVSSLLYKFILFPLGLTYLKTIVFILVIAALVQLVEMMFKKYMPGLYSALGIFLPLITTNCAVLGVALNNVTNGLSVAESIITGIGTAVGYLVAIVILAGIRERIDNSDIPQSFKGMPIVCIVAGIMAIAYMGFSNLAI